MGSLTLRLRKKALGDIGSIRLWYRKIDPSLETRFRQALNEALDRIQAFPFAYQVVFRNTRRISLKRFPYSVLYVIQPPKISVLAVIHHKRDTALAQGISE